MLARVDVVDVLAGFVTQQERPAAAQHVIQEILGAVGIKIWLTGVRGHAPGQLAGQLGGLGAFLLQVARRHQATLLRGDEFRALGMADQGIHLAAFAGGQRQGGGAERTQAAPVGDLALSQQGRQRHLPEGRRPDQGGILAEDGHRVHQHRQALAGRIEGQVEIAGLEFFDLGAVVEAGAHAVEWRAVLRIEHRHPGLCCASHLFQ